MLCYCEKVYCVFRNGFVKANGLFPNSWFFFLEIRIRLNRKIYYHTYIVKLVIAEKMKGLGQQLTSACFVCRGILSTQSTTLHGNGPYFYGSHIQNVRVSFFSQRIGIKKNKHKFMWIKYDLRGIVSSDANF